MKSQNTLPEVLLGDALDELGRSHTTHDRTLPGTPDIVFRAAGMVVFVHGCFWHRHVNCSRATHPKTDRWAWVARFEQMVQRDQEVLTELRSDGWWVYVAWECGILRRPISVAEDVARFLDKRDTMAKTSV